MRYFIDAEFDDETHDFGIEIISFAVVSQNGKSFYGVSSHFNEAGTTDWLKANVVPKLPSPKARMNAQTIRSRLASYFRQTYDTTTDGKPVEFWARNGSYDYVILCKLMGNLLKLENFFIDSGASKVMYRDIKDLLEGVDKSTLPKRDPNGLHDALQDTLYERQLWHHLTQTPMPMN